MHKIILWLLLFISLARSADLAESTVEIHAKIFPQVITFSQSFESSNSINIAIVYSGEYEYQAELFRDLILKNFSGNLKNKKLEVFLLHEANIATNNKNFQAAYILSNNANIRSLVANLTKKGVLTFAGVENAMKAGSLIGLKPGDKIQLLINSKTYKAGNFSFNQSLIRMVKVYEED